MRRIQAEHGVHAHQVLRSTENPNDVIVSHTFDSGEAARTFFAMPELKEAMSQGGVNAELLRNLLFRRGRKRRAGWRVVRAIAGPRCSAGAVHSSPSVTDSARLLATRRMPLAIAVLAWRLPFQSPPNLLKLAGANLLGKGRSLFAKGLQPS